MGHQEGMGEKSIPASRRIMEALTEWLAKLAAPYLPPKRVFRTQDTFGWEFTEHTPEALLVGKAVRMVSGVRAALILADQGYTAECRSLLRMVSDYSAEVIFIIVGLTHGPLNSKQIRFIQDYFRPLPVTQEEWDQHVPRGYVGRKDLLKGLSKLAQEANQDPQRLLNLRNIRNQYYDRYVHGDYHSTMEMYSGKSNRFMVDGHESEHYREILRRAVAGRLSEVLVTMQLEALQAGMRDLVDQIEEARRELETSGECRLEVEIDENQGEPVKHSVPQDQ